MSRSNRAQPKVIRDPEWKFDFGRWKGETISEVMFCDPQYIEWLMTSTDFDVHQDIFDAAEDRYRQGMDILYKRDLETD